ncbi:MAG: hypothetical protein KDA66_16335, partial [Planctomycetaceae bacterium]|nr:hypothetical protein [Planctomycetaceae bacterium]
DLPLERVEHGLRDAQRARELVWTLWLCRLSPLIFLACIPLVSLFLVPLLFLKPVEWGSVSLVGLFSVKSLVVAAAVASLPWIWRLSLGVEGLHQIGSWPIAFIMALVGIGLMNGALTQPRARWFFVEWAKVRTANPSFARNTLFWERRDFPSETFTKFPRQSVALVGSSQMYQSTDLDLLAELTPDEFEKNCLAGFGPMQYPWLVDRILERKPDVVVCWLSEFDFYRETAVPTGRLRWAATNEQTYELFGELSPRQRWENRGEFVDLTLASNLTLWRQREHVRQSLLNYWWNLSRPANAAQNSEVDVLAQSVGLEGAIKSLSENVRRTPFVDINFASFRRFAQKLSDNDIKLLVFEGQLHPGTHVAYDAAFHQEVDERLLLLSDELNFQYVSGDALLRLQADDFADGYHTNDAGREKWSRFVAEVINQLSGEQPLSATVAN